VKLDLLIGSNDGTYISTAYFSCPPGHGTFVRPKKREIEEFLPDPGEVGEIG